MTPPIQKQSSSDKPIMVLKFGGTSVGNGERMEKVVEIVKSYVHAFQPVVVVSAMSSHTKSEGTTSRLLQATDEILVPNSQTYIDIVHAIQIFHTQAIHQVSCWESDKNPPSVAPPSSSKHANASLRDQAIQDVMTECERLRSFMLAAEIIDEISPRSRDVIVSTGEKLSARLLTTVFNAYSKTCILDAGQTAFCAEYVPVDRMTELACFKGPIVDQAFYDAMSTAASQRVLSVLSKSSSSFIHIPIVTGFAGPVPGSVLQTIGRGYTDLTAALLAVGLGASELQIWKEVDGIFSADPRKVPSAKLLVAISPDEAAELTYYGSEVIHPFTMEQVIRASIPIRIKNALKPEGAGTVILPADMSMKSDGFKKLPPNAQAHLLASPTLPHHAAPTAVTIKEDVVVLNVHSNRKSVSHGFLARIFETLDAHGIVVDLISTTEVHVSMALAAPHNEALQQLIPALQNYGKVDRTDKLAILSLVGRQMRHRVGMSAMLFSTLAKHHVNIEMISQGASEISISCVIEGFSATEALRAIHDECILEENVN